MVGYLLIVLESSIRINKAAAALLTAVICWVLLLFSGNDYMATTHLLMEQLAEIAGLVFFLLGAMTIVELIDAHNGFDIITQKITTTNKRKLPSEFSKSIGLTLCGMVDEPTSPAMVRCLK